MAEEEQKQCRWYGHWWGKLFLGLLAFFSLIVLGVVVMTAVFWWQIKHGNQPTVGLQGAGSFTASLATDKANRLDRARLETEDDPSIGRAVAPVTIVEFVDFKCPNSLAAAPIMNKVMAQYGTKVRWIVRDFPAESVFPGATKLAEVAYCANQQRRFWPMHQILYDEQNTLSDNLSDSELSQLAERTGANLDDLKTCLATTAPSQEVKADYFAGISAGVRGTPTFFVNGEKVEGVVPFASWENFLKNF